MLKKLFSKKKDSGHIIYNILGIKLRFIDVCGKLDKIEKAVVKEDPVNKILEKYLYAPDECEKYDYLLGGISPSNVDINKQIWTCWLQGEENEPEIVKFCINKIKKYYPDTIVITEDNINDYITLPDYIWEKYKKGNIRACHFADVVRVVLLDKYGGIWIDSTCYLTQPIPEFILKHECFFIQYAGEKEFSNWFIRSR